MTPKVLIIGQPFNLNTGGGITISSLFESWQKENLLLATTPNRYKKHSGGKCTKIYIIGEEDIRVRFPFNIFIKNQKSEIKLIDEVRDSAPKAITYGPISFYNLLYKIYYNLGLNFITNKTNKTLSGSFKKWLLEENPDIIYTQLANYEINKLVINIQKELNFKFAIHIMDDWPIQSAKGPFSKLLQNKLANDFKEIINKSNLLMCISQGMANEYIRRYGKLFSSFHYAIDYSNSDHEYTIPKEKIKLFYAGRVGFTNQKTLINIIKNIEKHNISSNLRIEFTIYTPDILKLKKYSGHSTIINESVSNTKIKEIISTFDLMILPLDFDKSSINYTKFSLPTKFWEYVNSDKPIVYIGPTDIYINNFIKDNNCGFIINSTNFNEFSKLINDFSNKEFYQEIINKISNARNLIKDKLNSIKMKREFYDLMKKISNGSK